MKISKKTGIGLLVVAGLLTLVVGLSNVKKVAAAVGGASGGNGPAFLTVSDFSNATYTLVPVAQTGGVPAEIDAVMGGTSIQFFDSQPLDNIYNFKPKSTYFCDGTLFGSKNFQDAVKGISLDASFGALAKSGGSSIPAIINFDYINAGSKCVNYQATATLNVQANGSISSTPVSNVTGSQQSTSCASKFNSGFEWVMCPILDIADSIAGAFNGFIENQMCFNTGATSSTGGVVCNGQNNLTDSVHRAWSIFRNIATALLVIAMLIMVISQAIGGGPFDAYTIRKLLPKLVAAVIIMQLSWMLFKWSIDLSNDAGIAIRDLMFAPFGGGDKLQLDQIVGTTLNTHTTGSNNLFAFFGVLAGGVGLLALSIPGLAMLAFYAVMALLTAFIVLIFRKLLIIMLIILAPLALVAWILPGTDRYWKLWSDNFTKLLLMFPMIMGLIAAGRIFASITAGNTASMFSAHPILGVAHLGNLPIPYVASVTGYVDLAIIVAAYFGPYFLLPQTYKWGGAAMGAAAKGIKQGVEKAGSPAKDYLTWRKGITPWKQARAARRSEQEKQAKLGFYNNLSADSAMGRARRARLGGIGMPGAEGDLKTAIVRRGRQAAEAEEVKEASEALRLEMNQSDDHDAFLRDVVNSDIDPEARARVGHRTDLERVAALGELARVGGASNMRAIEEAHGRAFAPGANPRERELYKKFLDTNSDKLLGPMRHLYFGTEPAELAPGVPNPVAGRINVHSTVEGLKASGIASMDGVEMETLLGELTTRIDTLPAGSVAHTQALSDFATLTSVFHQAATNETIRPNIAPGVSKAMKAAVDGTNLNNSVANLTHNPDNINRGRVQRDAAGNFVTDATGNPIPRVGNPIITASAVQVNPATGVVATTPLGTALAGVDPSILTALSHLHSHIDNSGVIRP